MATNNNVDDDSEQEVSINYGHPLVDGEAIEHQPEHFAPGDTWETLVGEQIDVIDSKGPERSGDVVLRYPKRTHLDADGKSSDYTEQVPRTILAARAAHENYDLVATDVPRDDTTYFPGLAGEFKETPRCPSCGKFCTIGWDGTGLPMAKCSSPDCNGFLDDQDLISAGKFEVHSKW
jgi:hypothetical protein